MVASTYDDALRRLLAHEGGYTNDPRDPGGPTNFGITLADYRRYVKPNATAADVRAMHPDKAKAIYRARYWDAMRCDDLPAGVDYAVFDYGVNSGIGRAPKVVERIIRSATVDGKFSDSEMAAIRQKDARVLINAICDERLAFLKSLKTWPAFGGGWARRVAEVRVAAIAMTMASVVPPPAVTAAAGKGVVTVNTAARNGTVGVTAMAGVAAVQQAHAAAVSPLGLAAVVVATTAFGIAVWLYWHWRQTRQQQAPASAQQERAP